MVFKKTYELTKNNMRIYFFLMFLNISKVQDKHSFQYWRHTPGLLSQSWTPTNNCRQCVVSCDVPTPELSLHFSLPQLFIQIQSWMVSFLSYYHSFYTLAPYLLRQSVMWPTVRVWRRCLWIKWRLWRDLWGQENSRYNTVNYEICYNEQ